MYGISIDARSGLSSTRQLCDQLRGKIESGELPAGTKLPPTRGLSKEWGIARNIVIEVYEQLTAEGYLDGRVGSGTYVAEGAYSLARQPASSADTLPSTGERSVDPVGADVVDFSTGIPDLRLFPRKIWAKTMRAVVEEASPELFGYGDIQGDPSLRAVLCDYLYKMKGIHCPVERMVIVSGSSEGFLLAAKSLSPNYRSVYVEDPTIEMTREIFRQMNYSTIPVEVDEHGMNLDALRNFEPGHLALLTPSHQFPTGSLLSIQRRQKAVRMAAEAGTYLIEDDYDGEFRLKGIPVPSLYSLDPARVLYVGTFSKTLSPGLRIGFVIVPPDLLEAVIATKNELHLRTPLLMQRALSRFIADGHLARHVYEMKKAYKKRRTVLIERMKFYFKDDIRIAGDHSGMHLHVEFLPESYRNLPWDEAIRFGFRADTIEGYRMERRADTGSSIVLGYGSLDEKGIERGAGRLRDFVSYYVSI